MKNNQFSKDELAQMRSYYQNEYNQLQLKIKHVVEVLKKLEPVAFSDEIADIEIKTPIKKALVKVADRKGKRGPGRPKKIVAEVVSAIKEKVAAPIKVKKVAKPTTKKVAAKKVVTKKVVKPKEVATANVSAVKEPKQKKVTKKVAPKVKKVKAVVKPIPKVKPVKKGSSLKKPIKSGTGDSKVKWNDFIVNTLLHEEKPFLLSNFTQRAVSELNIPADDSERAKMAIAGTLTRITKVGNEIKTYKKQGQKGSFYVLSTWLDESGKLKPEYVNKI